MSIFIEQQTTERGFIRLDFEDRYKQQCSLQKSSLAGEDAIWLGVDVNIDGKNVGERMHLTQEMVSALIPYLQHFVDTGELPATQISDERT